jgi:hypothetical protein
MDRNRKQKSSTALIFAASAILILALGAAALAATGGKAAGGTKAQQKMNYKPPINEVMTYSIKALGVTLGTQENTTRGIVEINGRRAVNIYSKIKTSPWIKFYSLDNSMETFIDIETLKPYKYEEKANEKDWRAIDVALFFPGKLEFTQFRGDKLDKVEKGTLAYTEWPQDELSIIYYVRHLPLEVGKIFKVNSCVDSALQTAVIIVKKKQEIKTAFGKKEVFQVTSSLGDSEFMIGTDNARIPYQFYVKLNIGGMKGILKEYSPSPEQK